MKYIDKKYELGETKDICNEKQNGGDGRIPVIYYYKTGCPACEEFNDDWEKLKKEKKTKWKCEKIKYSDNINPKHKKLIETVPAIIKNDELYSGNRSDLFNM